MNPLAAPAGDAGGAREPEGAAAAAGESDDDAGGGRFGERREGFRGDKAGAPGDFKPRFGGEGYRRAINLGETLPAPSLHAQPPAGTTLRTIE